MSTAWRRRRRSTARATPGASSYSTSPGHARPSSAAWTTTPSCVCAIPFTPATGPRLLCRPGLPAEPLRAALLDRAARARDSPSACPRCMRCSSTKPARGRLRCSAGWLLRRDCHFQWHNRGYRDFDDFLAAFSAEKRKKARRERRRVLEQGIEFQTLRWHELTEQQLERVYGFHALTFIRARPHALPEPQLLHARGARAWRPLLRQAGGAFGGGRWPRRCSSAPTTRSTAAIGAPKRTITACTSRPATTRASTTASSTACSTSSPARRASTRSRAASSRRLPGRRTGSRMRRCAARSAPTCNARAARSTPMPARRMRTRRSARASDGDRRR